MGMVAIVEYYAQSGHEEQVATLLASHWSTLREEGFVTDQPAFLMRDPDEAGLFIEVFSWLDEEGPERAWDNSRISEMWHTIQDLCEEDIQPEYFEEVTALTPGGN